MLKLTCRLPVFWSWDESRALIVVDIRKVRRTYIFDSRDVVWPESCTSAERTQHLPHDQFQRHAVSLFQAFQESPHVEITRSLRVVGEATPVR